MKVLFINHKDIEGGAAVAAFRLHRGLEKYFQSENIFIVSQKYSGSANVFTPWEQSGETVQYVCRFIEFLLDRVLGRLGLQYYSFPFSTRFILKKACEFRPDIISLHNTHGGYFKTSLIKGLSKIAPVVWTLHDMWAFTANAAHTFGDESWKEMKAGEGEKKIYPHVGMGKGRRLLKRKKRIYNQSDVHLVAPSRWLYGLASEAPVFKGKPIRHIFHGLDLEVFKPRDKRACREALGLPLDGKVVMFSCVDDLTGGAWKGGPLLLDILRELDRACQEDVQAMVLGKGNLDGLGELKHVKVHHMGYIRGEGLIPVLYAAADLLIYPTRADNLSLVLMESIACGTPCITFAIGGNSDIIENNISGFLVEPFDIEAFVSKTLDCLGDREKLAGLSRCCRQRAEERFSLKDMATNYFGLFAGLVREN